MPTGAGLPAETLRNESRGDSRARLSGRAQLDRFLHAVKTCGASFRWADKDICPYVNSLSYHLLHGCLA
jgi:hypothetical protein